MDYPLSSLPANSWSGLANGRRRQEVRGFKEAEVRVYLPNFPPAALAVAEPLRDGSLHKPSHQ